MLGALFVVAAEVGVTWLIFVAEYENPFRIEPIPLGQKLIHIAVSGVVAIGHIVLAKLTAAVLILVLRHSTAERDRAAFAAADWDDVEDADFTDTNPQPGE